MFWSKNKASRDALIASMPVDENGDVPEDYLRARNDQRSARSRVADGRSTAKRVYPIRMPPEQAASWVSNPGRSDVSGIDTKSPANIERRERKAEGKAPAKPKAPSKPKAKPRAPAKPKAPSEPKKPQAPKAPKIPEPSAPIPDKESGVVVSGREILDIVKMLMATNCKDLALGCGSAMYNTNSAGGIALERKDGRGLFGLDEKKTYGRFVNDMSPLSKLDAKSVYKVSLEDDTLTFRQGPDFSKEALSVPVVKYVSDRSVERIIRTCKPTHEFDLDSATLTRVLKQMLDTGSANFVLESSPSGTFVVSDASYQCGIEARIGGPTEGKGASALFAANIVLPYMKTVGQYLYSARFAEDRPIIAEGMFGEYRLYVMVAPMSRK